jgi:hypothetical protein
MNGEREDYADPEPPPLRAWVRVLLALLLAAAVAATLIGGGLLMLEAVVLSGPRFDD